MNGGNPASVYTEHPLWSLRARVPLRLRRGRHCLNRRLRRWVVMVFAPSAPGIPARFASLARAPFALRRGGVPRIFSARVGETLPLRASPAVSLRSPPASPFTSRKGRLFLELAAFYKVVEEVGVGFQFQSWSAKAKVWGWPPEWMKTTGVWGSRFRARISAMRADIDLPV